MSQCLIAIGSNYRRRENMLSARDKLEKMFPSICFAREVDTVPIEFKNPALFSNQVAVFSIDETLATIQQKLKTIEKEIGRCSEDKLVEKVCIDIDLLAYDGHILKTDDWDRDYIVTGLKELKNKIILYQMKFLGIIPARYASTRFPGKPLALLGGKTMIRRVYEQVSDVLDHVVVATDDERIEEEVLSFGGKVVMTSPDHKSGTDRCYEAFTKVDGHFDVVVNIQGDEPFIQKQQLEAIRSCFEDSTTQIATLVKPFTSADSFAALENVNSPKVVVNRNFNALYFSRSIIPYQRNQDQKVWLANHTYYKHIGLYAYRSNVLREITNLPQSALELAESLEQLRWLENGYTIKVGLSDVETIGIDTPEDLKQAEDFLRKKTDQE